MFGHVSSRRWDAALAEQDEVLAAFVSTFAAAITAEAAGAGRDDWWHRPAAPGKWSPAAVVLHVCHAYELGAAAATADRPGMRLLVPPVQAWLGRVLVLPLVLRAKRFPRGARAPSEVVPDEAEAAAVAPERARSRLLAAATESARVLRSAELDHPALRITHAYFGPLSPYTTLRLLSAHTRHHTTTGMEGGALARDVRAGKIVRIVEES